MAERSPRERSEDRGLPTPAGPAQPTSTLDRYGGVNSSDCFLVLSFTIQSGNPGVRIAELTDQAIAVLVVEVSLVFLDGVRERHKIPVPALWAAGGRGPLPANAPAEINPTTPTTTRAAPSARSVNLLMIACLRWLWKHRARTNYKF